MGNFFPDNKMLCGDVPFKKEVHAEEKGCRENDPPHYIK